MTLAVEDCMCPICMCILVEPVTMPCKHTLCYPCFKQNVEESSLACPMCRVRISVWARRSSKNGTLVNKKLWGQIQQLFPEKVEKRQMGLDDSIEDPVFQPMISIAEPGEIRKEYEEQMKRLEVQREEERRKEQEASEALIRKLEEEEEDRRKQLEVRDRELAQEISQEVNQNTTGDDSVSFVSEDAIRRQTRSVSSSSSSCSASSSRPPSTINSLFQKMREAEKLRAADEANRKTLSPYPYKCHSPTEKSCKQKKVRESGTSPGSRCSSPTEKSAQQHKGRELFSRSLSSTGLSSRSCTSTSEIGNLGDDDNDDDLPSKYVSLGIPSLETAIGNIGDRSDVEMFDKDSGERCQSSESMDSISQEISHFRPIRVCPLTPPRKLPSGKVVETPLIRTTPRNLNKTEFGSPIRTLSDLDASSPIMQRRLSELEEERKTNVNKFSKSTSTEVKKDAQKLKSVTVTCDDNLADKDDCERYHNVENTAIVMDSDKDNLDKNRILERKGVTENQEKKSSVDRHRLKRLVIPLEPTFDDGDFDIPPLKENNPKSINSETLTVSTKQSPVLTKSKSEQNTSVQRKSRKISGKSRMAFSSPQRTITDWIKNSTGCSGQSAFQLEAGCRDDVDGEPIYKMTQSEAVSVSQSSNGPARKERKKCKVVKSYPKRERKRYNPDPMWTFVSEIHKGQYIDIDESSKDSSAIRVLEEENDKPIVDQKSRTKKRTATSFSDAKPNKRRKVTEMCSASSRLKQTATKAKLKAVQHSHAKKSILNFCSESNLKRVKDAIKSDHQVKEEADFRASDIFDREMQEIMDRKLAEELSKQFEMEAKTGFQFFKLKGTPEEYNFRRRPKMSS